jgi:hypothetical protein
MLFPHPQAADMKGTYFQSAIALPVLSPICSAPDSSLVILQELHEISAGSILDYFFQGLVTYYVPSK